MKQLQTIGFAILFALVLLPGPAVAAEAVLRVALDDYPPWQMPDADGNPTGIEVEFIQRVAERMGLDVEYEFFPFKRGLHQLKVGEADLMIGVLKRAEREQYLHYVEPPYKNYSHKAFFILREGVPAIRKHADLHHYTVATRIGVQYYPEFDTDHAIRKEKVTSMDTSFKMLMAGRVDAVIVTETVGDWEVARRGLGSLVDKAEYIHRKQQEVFMVISKASPLRHRLDEFNAVVADLVARGEFERLRRQFLDDFELSRARE